MYAGSEECPHRDSNGQEGWIRCPTCKNVGYDSNGRREDWAQCPTCGETYCELCGLQCEYGDACPKCTVLVKVEDQYLCASCLRDAIAGNEVWACATHSELHLYTAKSLPPVGHGQCEIETNRTALRQIAQDHEPMLNVCAQWSGDPGANHPYVSQVWSK
jgi:hypothetical protein